MRSVVQYERAISTEPSYEQTQLEQHVVARRWSLGPSRDGQVVSRKNQHRKVEALKCQDKRFEGPLRESEDSLAPDFNFAGLIQKDLDRLRYPQALARRADKYRGLYSSDRHSNPPPVRLTVFMQSA